MKTLYMFLQEVQTLKTPEDLELFMLKHGENIVDIMGSEVDRIEKNFKVNVFPGVASRWFLIFYIVSVKLGDRT